MESTISNQIADQLSGADAVTIARLIKRYSLRRGWRMDELALRAGVSRTTLYQLLRGAIRKPRQSTLHKIAAALQIPLAYLQQHEEPNPSYESTDPTVSQNLQQKRRLDRATNAVIDIVEADRPECFRDWQEQHWDELYSTFGVGGALNYEGVLDRAEQINRNRKTVGQLQLVMETHLSELAQQIVHLLYQSIAIEPSADENTHASEKLEILLQELLADREAEKQNGHCQGKNS